MKSLAEWGWTGHEGDDTGHWLEDTDQDEVRVFRLDIYWPMTSLFLDLHELPTP